MKTLKFIVRLDDICPRMDWQKFSKIRQLLNEYQIKPIIGVVPNNKDKNLMVDQSKDFFWELINAYQNEGWTIAQHGYEHLYHTNNAGIFNGPKRSEFAGLSLEVQTRMLKKGKELLAKKGIKTNVFMAPSHSLDQNTINALKTVGFKYVTDGYGLFPYQYKGLTFVPQLFGSPLHFRYGIYTICLHTNELNEKQFEQLGSFFKKNEEKFISFQNSIDYTNNSLFNTSFASNFFRILRKGKSLIANDA